MLLLSAYAEDGDATRAVDLVVHLKSRYEATGLVNYKPTGKIAGACIAAMSRSQDPDKARLADTLLEEQMSAFESTGDKSLLPRAPFWTSYIDIMVSDGTTESLERAEEVLGKMRTDRGFIHWILNQMPNPSWTLSRHGRTVVIRERPTRLDVSRS
jgi:hypothetical protein